MYQADYSVVEVQDYIANLSVSLFHHRQDAIDLLDGVFYDGTDYNPESPPANFSLARWKTILDGKMTILSKTQANMDELAVARGDTNGEVIGNPLFDYGAINSNNAGDGGDWNSTLFYMTGGFDEMFGSFNTQNDDGSWDRDRMKKVMHSIVNASKAGKTISIHAFPGPATVPFPARGPPENQFKVASWKGDTPVPNGTDDCRQAAADRLVESLAPFLIVASETTFFSYAWFYELQDGYIPCKEGTECGMPSEWYPEFRRPLGPPSSDAVIDETGYIWKREFQHCSVYVDLNDRTASSITWH